MKIWHVGASASPRRVSGLNISAWVMAREQAALGHDVSLIIHAQPDQAGVNVARQGGFKLIYLPSNVMQYSPKALTPLLDSQPPDVVHMHSVFQPKHATLAKQLKRRQIPYVIKPAGGLLPQVLRRGQMQKSLYSWLLEKPRFMGAGAIAIVTPGEEKDVRAFVPHYQGIIRWMPNPIDADSLDGQQWKGPQSPKRLVFLGRFDVLHKGIDILVAIARWLPDVEFHLYGTEDAGTRQWFERIKQDMTPNVYFHRPVFGSEKFRVLSEANLYIQTARWEVFGISIAEAMYLGTPCAVAETIHFAELFQQYDLGLVLPGDPKEAAAQLKAILDQPEQMKYWSQQSQSFAHTYFHPQAVAQNYLKLYEEVASF
jgi:glycosyltransferase involved in cell wall biosynthesis